MLLMSIMLDSTTQLFGNVGLAGAIMMLTAVFFVSIMVAS
jgi:hypothetical protein